jgi:hypothetical protein
MKDLADKVLRILTAGSPALVCMKCGRSFLLASMQVRISSGGLKDRCPHCSAEGPFREASKNEKEMIAVNRAHWWFFGPLGLLILFAVGAVIWRVTK